jgi:hypothetical protein
MRLHRRLRTLCIYRGQGPDSFEGLSRQTLHTVRAGRGLPGSVEFTPSEIVEIVRETLGKAICYGQIAERSESQRSMVGTSHTRYVA